MAYLPLAPILGIRQAGTRPDILATLLLPAVGPIPAVPKADIRHTPAIQADIRQVVIHLPDPEAIKATTKAIRQVARIIGRLGVRPWVIPAAIPIRLVGMDPRPRAAPQARPPVVPRLRDLPPPLLVGPRPLRSNFLHAGQQCGH